MLVLDTTDVVEEQVASTVANIQKLGNEQYVNLFNVEERLNKRTTSLFTPLKRNKLPLFSCPQTKKRPGEKQQITSLKKTCSLFSQLYVSCQVRDGNLEEFFRHENQSYPPSLSKFGEMRSGTKADLVACLEVHSPIPPESSPDVDAILLDGAAIVNMLKPGPAKTFQQYSKVIFLPYLQSQLTKAERVDILWDEYIPDSLNAMTRQKRGKGTIRRVQPNTQIPGNWEAFLRISENKMELFKFLAEQSVSIQYEGKQVISTAGKLVLLNSDRDDVSRLAHTKRPTRGYYSMQQILQLMVVRKCQVLGFASV